MSHHLSGGCFYGGHSAEAGEGSLAPQPLGIVSSHDQQRRRVVGADSRQGEQLRGGICHHPIELNVHLGYLLREGLVTAGHRTQRELGCCLRCFWHSNWTRGRRYRALSEEIAKLDAQVHRLVAQAAPELISLPAVGTDHTATTWSSRGTTPRGWAARPPRPASAAYLP